MVIIGRQYWEIATGLAALAMTVLSVRGRNFQIPVYRGVALELGGVAALGSLVLRELSNCTY